MYTYVFDGFDAVPEARRQLHDLVLEALLGSIASDGLSDAGGLVVCADPAGDAGLGGVTDDIGEDGAQELVVEVFAGGVDGDEMLRGAAELVLVEVAEHEAADRVLVRGPVLADAELERGVDGLDVDAGQRLRRLGGRAALEAVGDDGRRAMGGTRGAAARACRVGAVCEGARIDFHCRGHCGRER